MRVARDESGKLCSAPEEWRNGEQPGKLLVISHDLQQRNVSKNHQENYLLNKMKPSARKTFKRGKHKDSCKNCRQRCTKRST